jgi:hypothetical protein
MRDEGKNLDSVLYMIGASADDKKPALQLVWANGSPASRQRPSLQFFNSSILQQQFPPSSMPRLAQPGISLLPQWHLTDSHSQKSSPIRVQIESTLSPIYSRLSSPRPKLSGLFISIEQPTVIEMFHWMSRIVGGKRQHRPQVFSSGQPCFHRIPATRDVFASTSREPICWSPQVLHLYHCPRSEMYLLRW